MNEEIRKKVDHLKDAFEKTLAEIEATYNTCIQGQTNIAEDLSMQVKNLSIQLKETRKERDLLSTAYIENQNTIRNLTETINNLYAKISEKNEELDFKKLLDRLLPCIKKIIENCEALTVDQLERFKETNLPQYREELSYVLEMLGIRLNYHNPGEMVNDIDDRIDVHPNYTADKSLSNQVYKSMLWGYGMIGEDSVIRKERVCVWIYDESMKSKHPKESVETVHERVEDDAVACFSGKTLLQAENRTEHTVEYATEEDTVLNTNPSQEDNCVEVEIEQITEDANTTDEALSQENNCIETEIVQTTKETASTDATLSQESDSTEPEIAQATKENNVSAISMPIALEEKKSGGFTDAERKAFEHESTENLEATSHSVEEKHPTQMLTVRHNEVNKDKKKGKSYALKKQKIKNKKYKKQ